MKELSTLNLPDRQRKEPLTLDFEAQLSDDEAGDKLATHYVAIEETDDGVTWRHVAGYTWEGATLDRDGKTFVRPSISVQSAGDRPTKLRIVTDAKEDSTLTAGKLEAKEADAIKVRT